MWSLRYSYEVLTKEALLSHSHNKRNLRPVYCPTCGLHYTMVKDSEEWPCSVKHVECDRCKGKKT